MVRNKRVSLLLFHTQIFFSYYARLHARAIVALFELPLRGIFLRRNYLTFDFLSFFVAGSSGRFIYNELFRNGGKNTRDTCTANTHTCERVKLKLNCYNSDSYYACSQKVGVLDIFRAVHIERRIGRRSHKYILFYE